MISSKWTTTLKVLPILAAVIVVKYGIHFMGWEILTVSPLFSAIISANIFLLGFLLAGVLTDYKESEKLPGELGASLEALTDEASITYQNKKTEAARGCLEHLHILTLSILAWFRKEENTGAMMEKLRGLNHYFLAFESLTQANFIVRMKQEQSALRRMLIRIHTVRETSFVSSGYAIAEAATFLLTLGMVLLHSERFHESFFIVLVITFVMFYILAMIRDLDNPFGYYERASAEDVSLKPIEDALKRIERELAGIEENHGGLKQA